MNNNDDEAQKKMKEIFAKLAEEIGPTISQRQREARDIGNKATEDTVRTLASKINLTEDITSGVFVAMCGLQGAAMLFGALLTQDPHDEKTPSDNAIHDRSLFAVLLMWFAKHPEFKGWRDAFDNAVRSWEATTGRSFDESWLRPDVKRPL